MVGFSFATDLVTTCRKFDANEAYDIGFISRVIKNEDFKKESAGLARIIGKKPEMALKITKQQLISIRNGNYNSKEDGELMLKSLASPEDKEANKKYVKKLS